MLEADRARTRAGLLADTERDLGKIKASVDAGLKDPDKIGIRVGKVINKRKVANYFLTNIGPGRFSWRRDKDKIAAEAAFDRIYVIRASVSQHTLDAAGAVTACGQKIDKVTTPTPVQRRAFEPLGAPVPLTLQ